MSNIPPVRATPQTPLLTPPPQGPTSLWQRVKSWANNFFSCLSTGSDSSAGAPKTLSLLQRVRNSFQSLPAFPAYVPSPEHVDKFPEDPQECIEFCCRMTGMVSAEHLLPKSPDRTAFLSRFFRGANAVLMRDEESNRVVIDVHSKWLFQQAAECGALPEVLDRFYQQELRRDLLLNHVVMLCDREPQVWVDRLCQAMAQGKKGVVDAILERWTNISEEDKLRVRSTPPNIAL